MHAYSTIKITEKKKHNEFGLHNTCVEVPQFMLNLKTNFTGKEKVMV